MNDTISKTKRFPTSEFILRRIIKHDLEGTPGWSLNPEMRGEFTRMLAEPEERKGCGHDR